MTGAGICTAVVHLETPRRKKRLELPEKSPRDQSWLATTVNICGHRLIVILVQKVETRKETKRPHLA